MISFTDSLQKSIIVGLLFVLAFIVISYLVKKFLGGFIKNILLGQILVLFSTGAIISFIVDYSGLGDWYKDKLTI
jgi:uncharacterized membrane protein